MRINQWQWLKSSLERPRFSEPKRTAVLAEVRWRRINLAPCSSVFKGCCSSRFEAAVVPTTRLQSDTASDTFENRSALFKSWAAPTADRASRNEGSYGFTKRRLLTPKLLIARAAAPMFNGLRVPTRTMHSRSSLAFGDIWEF